MLSILKGPKFEQILQKARDNWIEFTPTKEEIEKYKKYINH